MVRVSIFDLDHTLFKANASFRFGVYLFNNQVITTSKMLILVAFYIFYKVQLLSMHGLHAKIFNVLFLGKSLSTFEKHARVFVDENFEALINPPVQEKLNLARSQGHYIAIFSSSPDFLVQLIANKFNVNFWRASSYKTDAHLCFSELSEILTGPVKAQYLISLVHAIGVNLSKCEAYSDSYEDLPLLELVGKPIAVNPDRKLYTVCVKKNWEMI
jgi:HAD superfamily hydrolase (TIGR01490 family)